MPHLPDPEYDAAFYDNVLPKRFLAWAVDAALMLAAMLVLSLVTFGIAFLLWVPVHLALAFFYRWRMIATRGATLGMALMSLELRANSGQPLSSGQAAGHTAIFLTGALFFLIQLVSMGMMAARPLGRGLADEVVGTVMLNRAA